jgi:hypothetical protein
MGAQLEPPAFYRVMNPDFHAARKRFMTTAAHFDRHGKGFG